jgi:hypothetical protein
MMKRNELNIFISCAIACTIVLMFRRYDAFTHPQFYAEEGKYFFADAYNHGWKSLFYTLNGYFHLLPRFIMLCCLTLQIPLVMVPAIQMVFVFFIYLLLWFYIFTRLELSVFSRCLAMFVTIGLPLGNELLMTMTNIQWFLALFPAIIFFGAAPASGFYRLLDIILIMLCSFTGPFTLILLLLLFVVWFAFPNRKEKYIRYIPELLLLIIGAVFCTVVLFHHGIDRAYGVFSLSKVNFLQLLFYQSWFPVLSIYIHRVTQLMMIIFSFITILALIPVTVRLLKVKNEFSLFCFLCSITFFLVTCIAYRNDPAALSPFYCGIRNFYLPSIFFLFFILPLIEHASLYKPMAIIFLCWWMVQTIWLIGPLRFDELNWKNEIKRIGKNDTTVIPISPKGWNMKLLRNRSVK